MESLQTFLDAFFSFKAYVMLPIIIFLLALLVRLPLGKAFSVMLKLAAGFAGVFIAFDFFVANIGPAVNAISQVRNLSFPVLDVGWPPLAAITWASPIAPLSIPVILGLNIALLALGWTRTIYIDIWNYWHFALIGALVEVVTGSFLLGMLAAILLAVYSFKLAEWTARDVQREIGIAGVSTSPVSVNGIIPYTAVADWLFDRIPGFRKLDFNPEKKHSNLGLLAEPMFIGALIGVGLGIAAAYPVKTILELAVHIAAVMFLLPKSAELIGEAMVPLTDALRSQIESRFPKRKNLVVALDTGFLMNHRSVIFTGLILMPISIGIALILPGNEVLPLGDLPNLISVMSLSVLLFRGNVVRAVTAGIPVVVSFMLISTKLGPMFTRLAAETGAFTAPEDQLITAFTDGGHQARFLLLELFQGKLWAIIALAAVLASMVYTWKRSIRLSQVAETKAAE